MKIKTLACTLLVLGLPLTALGDYKVKNVSGNDLRDTILRLSDYHAANMLLHKGGKLGNKCNAQVNGNLDPNYITAKIGNKTINIGEKEISHYKTEVTVKKKFFGLFKVKKTKKIPVYKTARQDQGDQWKKELGSQFKNEIADVNWLCGTSSMNMQSRSIRANDLFSQVEFYEEENTGKIICMGPSDDNKKMRNPETCQMEPVLEVLNDKLCHYMVRLARKKSREMVFAGTMPGKKKKINVGLIKMPVFKPLTAVMRQKIELSRLIRDDVHVLTAMESVGNNHADAYLPQRVTQLLASPSATDFNSLQHEEKIELVNAMATVDLMANEPDLVQFSPELLQFSQAIKPQIQGFMSANEELEIEPYSIPAVADVVSLQRDRLLAVERVLGRPLSLGNCNSPIVKPIKLAPVWQTISVAPVNPIRLPAKYLPVMEEVQLAQ